MRFEELVADALEIDVDRVTDELSLDNCPEWTSLMHIALISELESTYGVEFDIEESIEMDSVASIRSILRSKDVKLDD